ncbi:RHS repeat-associated core domain-containing protein [Pseudomonas sp. LB3P81]
MQSPGETLLCQYRYDALDRLVANALPNEPERQRFYCKSRLATEIEGAIHYSIVQSGDQLLAQQRIEGGAHETSLLATDEQRSVLRTLNANQPPQPLVYSPYGYYPYLNALLSLLGFNGEGADPVTGCYLLGNGHRAFNPVLMRFNSPDSLSPFSKGGMNSYGYCLGDPINRRDPNGRFSIMKLFNYIRPRKIPFKVTGYHHEYKIRPEISTQKALSARNEIYQLQKEIGRHGNHLDKVYDMDYKAITHTGNASTNNSSLQQAAANWVPLQQFYDAPAPVQKLTLNHRTAEYDSTFKAVLNNLGFEKNGTRQLYKNNLLGLKPEHLKKSPGLYGRLENEYLEHLITANTRNINSLINQRDKIFRQHFIDIHS